jgi:hypothetical protein
MKIISTIFLLLGLISLCNQSHAWTVSGPGKITFIENGWFGEGLAIHMTSSQSGCNAPDTEYAVLSNHPAYKEIVALATSAFMASSDVEFVVEPSPDDCVFGSRTKIISIRLLK